MSTSLDPDQACFIGLDLVQTICKSYQQTTPVGEVLNASYILINTINQTDLIQINAPSEML